MGKEIERKFLLKGDLPKEIEIISVSMIEQDYLAIGDEEVRIRHRVSLNNNLHEYVMTIKKGKGLSREEVEIPISERTFHQLFGNHKPIVKKRTEFKFDNVVMYIDEYEDKIFDFKVVEIEFATEEEAKLFKVPDWLGEEVTESKEYKNQFLWKKLNEAEK